MKPRRSYSRCQAARAGEIVRRSMHPDARHRLHSRMQNAPSAFWGRGWLLRPAIKTGIKYRPIRRCFGPNDCLRCQSVRLIDEAQAHRLELRAGRGHRIGLRAASGTEPKSQRVARCRNPAGRSQRALKFDSRSGKDCVVGWAAGRDLLTMAAPALPDGNRFGIDLKRHCAARALSGIAHRV